MSAREHVPLPAAAAAGDGPSLELLVGQVPPRDAILAPGALVRGPRPPHWPLYTPLLPSPLLPLGRPLWGNPELLDRSNAFYFDLLPNATSLARFQVRLPPPPPPSSDTSSPPPSPTSGLPTPH